MLSNRSGKPGETGNALYSLVEQFYPICRSITGEGVRQTLDIIKKRIGLTIHEVSSGTKVFDWTVPPEWNIRDAFVARRDGSRIIDFNDSNLHTVSYSIPVKQRMTRDELLAHIHTLPDQTDHIPYRTSYYAPAWGFCLQHRRLAGLNESEYDAVIDSSLQPGSLTYGELYLPGASKDEVLLSTHICHPSLANDNCSGMAVLTFLAEALSRRSNRYSYRLLFLPGTIGSITWLAANEQNTANIKHGLVISGVGDGGGPIYKRSRRGEARIDRVMSHAFAHAGKAGTIFDYFPYGYDERQYCSPGFDLPVGLFQNSKYGDYAEYHTSGDNLTFVRPAHLEASYDLISTALQILEEDGTFLSTNPKCEPQLGKRGLYGLLGGDKDAAAKQMTMLWTLAYADGKHSLLDIAEKARVPFRDVKRMSDLLKEHGLLKALEAKGE
jgi:aminopeptidase-like protein